MAMLVDDWFRKAWDPHRIRFGSPMDTLLQSLIASFRATYKVIGYDTMMEQPPSPQPALPPSDEELYPEFLTCRDESDGIGTSVLGQGLRRKLHILPRPADDCDARTLFCQAPGGRETHSTTRRPRIHKLSFLK